MNFLDVKPVFEENGYCVLKDFISLEECDTLRSVCHSAVDEMDPDEHLCLFDTDPKGPKQVSNDYFLNSGDKVRFFFEAEAVDSQGKLKVDKYLGLNKIGHAMHVLLPEFHDVTFSPKVKALVRDVLDYKKPTIPQSMYIFKQPHIGGKVTCHQDAIFLHTSPENKVVGIWVALEDTTEQNGCLKFIPGSHKAGIDNDRKMIRNENRKSDSDPLLVFTSPLLDRPDSEFVSVPVSKGSAILIDGLVVHKSAENRSPVSRHIYTFHLFESHNVIWSPLNWLQRTNEMPFPVLYENID